LSSSSCSTLSPCPPPCSSLPVSPPMPTPFPYTTLFRSDRQPRLMLAAARRRHKFLRKFPAVFPQRILINLCLLLHSAVTADRDRSEEHTSELQSRFDLICRLLLANNKCSRISTRRR